MQADPLQWRHIPVGVDPAPPAEIPPPSAETPAPACRDPPAEPPSGASLMRWRWTCVSQIALTYISDNWPIHVRALGQIGCSASLPNSVCSSPPPPLCSPTTTTVCGCQPGRAGDCRGWLPRPRAVQRRDQPLARFWEPAARTVPSPSLPGAVHGPLAQKKCAGAREGKSFPGTRLSCDRRPGMVWRDPGGGMPRAQQRQA